MSEFGYIPESPEQSAFNNKGIFSPKDIYNLDKADKWTPQLGQLELIETFTPSGVSSFDITNFGTGYDVHFLTFNDMSIGDNRDLYIRVYVGGVEQSGASDYGRAFQQGTATGSFAEDRDPDLHLLRVIPEMGNIGTGEGFNGYMYMYNAEDSAKYTFFTQQFSSVDFNNAFRMNFGSGIYQQANTLSGLKLYPNAGNISGSVSIYGIKAYS